jgi:mycothiol synthase
MRSVRDFRAGDEAAVRGVMLAALDVDQIPGWTPTLIDFAMSRLPIDPGGVLVATDGDEVVGYWLRRSEDIHVHPAHRRRGHGRRLFDAALARSAEAGDPLLVLHVPAHLPASRAFAGAVGLAYRSSLWQLRLPPERLVAVPAIGPDLVLGHWTEDIDVDAFVAFANAAWEGHPTPLGLTRDLALLVAELPDFDPTGICLVSRRDDPGNWIGFVKVEVRRDEDDRPLGWIGQLGVLPAQRGRGLGRMLLEWAVSYLRSRGAGAVELPVEASNERALGLYRRTGFVPSVEWQLWAIPVAASARPVADTRLDGGGGDLGGPLAAR